MKPIVLLILMAPSLLSHAYAQESGSKRDRALAAYSDLKIDEASTVLTSIIDQESNPKKRTWCGLTSKNAKQILNRIHAIYDDRVKSLALDYRSKKIDSSEIKKWAQECASGCHCGFYANVFDLIGEAARSEDHESIETISALAAKQTAVDTANCAERSKWVCKSSLFKHAR